MILGEERERERYSQRELRGKEAMQQEEERERERSPCPIHYPLPMNARGATIPSLPLVHSTNPNPQNAYLSLHSLRSLRHQAW